MIFVPFRQWWKFLLTLALILALVAFGYGLFIWFVLNIMKGGVAPGLWLFAIVAGVASFFNPCSFPVLPAYLAQYYTNGSSGTETPGKSKILLSGFIAALGVTTFNILLGSLIGILGAAFGQSFQLAGEQPSSLVRWFRGGVGVVLLVLGFSHTTGRGIDLHFLEAFFQKFGLSKVRNRHARIFSYGFGYTMLGIGCGGPILAGLAIYALSQGGLPQALFAFLIYSLVMAVMMILVSTLVAFSKETLLKSMGQSLLAIKKTSGVLLFLVGLFLILTSIFTAWFTGIFFP